MVARTVVNLPATVTSLSLASVGMYEKSDGLFGHAGGRIVPTQAEDFFPHLAKQAAQFTQLYAIDPINVCLSTHRGLYNTFVLALTNVQKLTISPYAISNLTNVLGQLPRLRHLALALREYDGYAAEMDLDPPEGAEFPAREVVKLLRKVRQLERVEVWSSTRASWSGEEQAAIEAAAAENGVAFEFVDGGEGAASPFIYPMLE